MNLKAYIDKYKDDRFFNEVFTSYHYDLNLTILDVGALAGEFSFGISPFAKQVYAIEPNSDYFRELESNIKEFEFNNVLPFKLALARESGMGTLNNNSRGGDTLGAITSDQSELVETSSLPDFISENKIKHIDILKIDIENGEEEVFKAKDILNVLKITDLIVGEHLDSTEGLLVANGFKVTHLDHNKIFKKKK